MNDGLGETIFLAIENVVGGDNIFQRSTLIESAGSRGLAKKVAFVGWRGSIAGSDKLAHAARAIERGSGFFPV